MRERIVQIDQSHSRAICHEIGQRLRFEVFRDSTGIPADLRIRIERLRELDDDSPPIDPSAKKS